MAVTNTPQSTRMTVVYAGTDHSNASFNNLNPTATPQQLATFVMNIAEMQVGATITDVRLDTEYTLTSA